MDGQTQMAWGEGGARRWQLDDLLIDAEARRIVRGDQTIELPQLSFRFLMALVEAAPAVLSIDELMERVWPGVFVNAETVTQRAKLVRDALGDDSRSPRYFSVRRGMGYQLIPVPVVIDREPHDRPPVRHRRRILAALALALSAPLALAGYAHWQQTRLESAASTVRVAVLPFENLSSDPADAFIARTIPEIVLNRLSSTPGLTVISRDSALLSKELGSEPGDAAKLLDVAYIVRGSVQREGNALRVTCFLVDTASGARLWSERFDWPIEKLYALQDRIADRVASSLDKRVRGIGEPAPRQSPTSNTDAYLAYLRGKALLGRFTVGETDAAARQFARSVKLDPGFAPAMVALFDARMQGADLRKEDLAPVRARLMPLLDRALQLDPSSGEALFAKAMWSNAPAAEKLRLFRRAAALDPSNARGLTAFARTLDMNANGRTGAPSKEAKALLDRVLAIDPLSPAARFWAVQRRWTTFPPDQLQREMARELLIDPQNYMIAERYAFRRWLIEGETADAIDKIEDVIASDPQNPQSVNMAMAFYLDADDPVAARSVAATTPATQASSQVLLAQYRGDWRAAGTAAFQRGGYLFNEYQSWNWPQALRDHALHTKAYDRSARAIAARYGIDLANPRIRSPRQANGAVALGHILLAKGDDKLGTRILVNTVNWIDAHPSYGLAVHMRLRAAAMMLLGETDVALSNLKSSFETGGDIHHWWYVIDQDPVWDPVRKDIRFRIIADYCRSAAARQRAKLDALRRAGEVPVRTAAS
jgi:TolB-like protein/DNA-binding winged helix-turn-helix (wHTH) protein